MKSTLTISFFIVLFGLTLVASGGFLSGNKNAYKKLLEKLKARIDDASDDFLPFEFKENVIERLSTFTSKYREIYVNHDKPDGIEPATSLTKTIKTIFQEYRNRTNANVELLDFIQAVDPIGFIEYSIENLDKSGTAESFASAILDFHSTTVHRRYLRNSKMDLSYIQPFESNRNGQLHNISDAVLAEIATENAYLDDFSMNLFVDIVNEHFKKQKMYYQFEFLWDNYTEYKSSKIDDVQILYGGRVEVGAVGHWICTYYQASTRQLYIYDSLNGIHISTWQRKVTDRLYIKREGGPSFVRPKQIQNDRRSCGIFAIFYATTLLLGEKPEIYETKMNNVYGDSCLYMRLHILNMFANRKLAPFIQINRS